MLEVSNLNAAYGHARVLHDISFDLEAGQTAFIIGRNGAGKTTLLRTITGLLKPASGSIRYEDQDISGCPPEELALKGIRFVAQEKKVFSQLTVKENIQIAAHAMGEPLDQAVAKVTSIYPKLETFLNTKAGSLSGGQRQILLVGRALVGSPKLLLIDEPTQGLAAIVIQDIGRILKRLKDQVSALIVEQNLSMVKRLADRLFIMKEGKITKEINDRAQMADTRGLEEYV